VSKVPDSWESIPLGEVIQTRKGKKPRGLGPESEVCKVPYITIKAFEKGIVDKYAPEQEATECKVNDTLLVWDGARSGLSGRGMSGYVGSTIARVRSDLANADYLYYFIDSCYSSLNTQTKGVGIPHVNPAVLNQFEFPLPPSNEQVRIVEKLEELFTDLDNGVAELKAAQVKLGQYRQSLLKSAVDGSLTEQWRAEHADSITETGEQLLQRILKERRERWQQQKLAEFKSKGKKPPKDWQQKYPEPVQPDVLDLPELPHGWVWASIGQCFNVKVGATPSRKEPSYWNGAVPWVSSGEVQFGRIQETKELITLEGLSNSSTQVSPRGSVLLGMIGEGKTRGQAAILDIDAANNQNCAAIRVPETNISSEYVFYWFWSRYSETRRGSSGNNQPALNKTLIEKMPIPISSINEMAQIGELLDTEFVLIKSKDEATEFTIKQAEAQKKNILKSAFSGELVPQDLNDEPASILLERIREERVARSKQKKAQTRKVRA